MARHDISDDDVSIIRSVLLAPFGQGFIVGTGLEVPVNKQHGGGPWRLRIQVNERDPSPLTKPDAFAVRFLSLGFLTHYDDFDRAEQLQSRNFLYVCVWRFELVVWVVVVRTMWSAWGRCRRTCAAT
jgi:hypothetical protein